MNQIVPKTSTITRRAQWLAAILLVVATVCLGNAKNDQVEDLLDMSLEDLMNLEIEASSSLTKTSRRLSPSTMTTISQEEIRNSGARSLYELLEIYVPNLQMIFHSTKLRHLGLRGINSDRDDKYLLLVNGRVMNEKTDYGAMTERDMPMLTDIHHIDIVRGPGSGLYGPGALAMVINIITDTARTFQGLEATARMGAVEEFYSGEVKIGTDFGYDKNGPDTGLLLYAGVTEYPGSRTKDSPLVMGRPTTFSGESFSYDQEIPHTFEPFNKSFQDKPKWKLHGHYHYKGLEFWARYTKGGEYIDSNLDQRAGEDFNQQTYYLGYTHNFSPELSLQSRFSYDRMQVLTVDQIYQMKSYAEDEYNSRILATWKPNNTHSLALGGEWSHEKFGIPNDKGVNKGVMYLMNGAKNKTWENAAAMPKWHTDLYSILGEYQVKLSEFWTGFLGSRWDWHSYVEPMWSPKATAVYTPNRKETVKLMASRSMRTSTGRELWTADNNGETAIPEELKAYELRYDNIVSDSFQWGGSLFYHIHKAIGWISGGVGHLGIFRSAGAELELTFRQKKGHISLSHGYTNLLSFDGSGYTQLTSAHMGYGSDFANWHDHITKLVGHHQVTDRLGLDGSVYIYWGSPGGEAYAKYKELERSSDGYVIGFNDAFDISAFLNLGMTYKLAKHTSVQLYGHNLLGLIDSNLNGRMYGYTADGSYRKHASALSITLTHKTQ